MSYKWKGVSLPWDGTLAKFFETKLDSNKLKTAVLFSVLTGLGERVMEPTFGSEIPRSVFEQNSLGMESILESSIRDSLVKDRRVAIVDIDVQREGTTAYCTLSFRDATVSDGEGLSVDFTLTV